MQKVLDVLYVNPENTGRIVRKEDGRIYPEMSELVGIGRLAPLTQVWKPYFIGYKQFTSICQYKSYKTEKGARAFLDSWLEQAEYL